MTHREHSDIDCNQYNGGGVINNDRRFTLSYNGTHAFPPCALAVYTRVVKATCFFAGFLVFSFFFFPSLLNIKDSSALPGDRIRLT